MDEEKKYSSHHEFVPKLINHLRVKTVVEVGVFRGKLAQSILSQCPNILYYAVDPWHVYEKELGAGPFMGMTQDDWDEMYERVKEKIEKYPNANVLRAASRDGAGYFANHSLDFVYIDAVHTYDALLRDIEYWWPKVDPLGYLAGHDMRGCYPGIQRAVEAHFGDQYHCGSPTKNWDYVWYVGKWEVA